MPELRIERPGQIRYGHQRPEVVIQDLYHLLHHRSLIGSTAPQISQLECPSRIGHWEYDKAASSG